MGLAARQAMATSNVVELLDARHWNFPRLS